MFQAFLIKYGEIGIKGKNRHLFEDALVRQIKYALKPVEGEFLISKEPPACVWNCGHLPGGADGG